MVRLGERAIRIQFRLLVPFEMLTTVISVRTTLLEKPAGPEDWKSFYSLYRVHFVHYTCTMLVGLPCMAGLLKSQLR